MRISNIIEKPIITEKTIALGAENRYVFKVNMKASKGSVAKEIKRIYDVDVDEVNTMIMPGKKRRVMGTRRFTKTRKWKKAVVKLKEGSKIDLVGN